MVAVCRTQWWTRWCKWVYSANHLSESLNGWVRRDRALKILDANPDSNPGGLCRGLPAVVPGEFFQVLVNYTIHIYIYTVPGKGGMSLLHLGRTNSSSRILQVNNSVQNRQWEKHNFYNRYCLVKIIHLWFPQGDLLAEGNSRQSKCWSLLYIGTSLLCLRFLLQTGETSSWCFANHWTNSIWRDKKVGNNWSESFNRSQ